MTLETGVRAAKNVEGALGSAGDLVPVPVRQMGASVVLETT